MQIEQFIKQERERQGLTRYALAMKAHTSPQAIAYLEKGDRLKLINKALNALGYQINIIKI
jgi:transcriptional regulator with XRE-family HTH domain